MSINSSSSRGRSILSTYLLLLILQPTLAQFGIPWWGGGESGGPFSPIPPPPPPSPAPTAFPTPIPTPSPTSSPTAPTASPTSAPTAPTAAPTTQPTAPTSLPTSQPTSPTSTPTSSPTALPTALPTPLPGPPGETHVPHKPPVAGEKYNYGQVMSLSLFFFEAQRSGKLPPTNRIPWRGDSALGDGSDVGLDLTGGWYDAGDHVKFNFPMAWSATTLAWGVHEYWDSWQKVGELEQVLGQIKWVTDYLIKCHPDPNTYYVQVGNGNSDHQYWGTAETMTMSRPSYSISTSNPGSDAAGEAAASLASAALLFNAFGDTVYATKLIDTARSLFDLAYNHQGKFSASSPFYSSSGFTDELAWAAAWLYKATGEQDYLDKAESLFGNCCGGAWSYSWDSKAPGVQLLLYKITGDQKYADAANGFLTSCFKMRRTPKGLAYWDQWGSNRYAANGAFIALVAADYGLQVDNARAWAIGQINYMLGDAHGGINADTGLPFFSYVAGYGDDYPKAPHHRGASCYSGTNCNCGTTPEPHVLYGALVGGPGQNDDYQDSCQDYTKNEVTTDYNAGFTSALAAIKHLSLTKQLPVTIQSVDITDQRG